MPERIFPIGRLDKDSEGLILLTNDGDIVNEILRSENNHEKEYIVTVERTVTDLALSMMAGGVKIMGEITLPAKVTRIGDETFRIILTQGLNRQIRRMCSALGYKVRRLQRVRIINIELGALRAGEWRDLTASRSGGTANLEGSKRGGLEAVRPSRSVRRPPVGIPRPRRQPLEEVVAAAVPVGAAEKECRRNSIRCGSVCEGRSLPGRECSEFAANAPTRCTDRGRPAEINGRRGRTGRYSAGLRGSTRFRAPAPAAHRRASDALRRLPLEHHALTAEIDYRDGGGLSCGPCSQQALSMVSFQIAIRLRQIGTLAKASRTMPAVRSWGSTTGSVVPAFEL